MLISLQHLVDRARHPRSRADELLRLRARFAVQPSRRQASVEQRAAADSLRSLRKELSAALSQVDSCGSCAKGHPLPAGRYDGGHCCSGNTLTIFSPEQVAALKVGGSTTKTMHPPRTDHVGCAFRGPVGCTLNVEDRPTLCVRYMCMTLREELRDHPDWKHIGKLSRQLDEAFARFKRTLP